MTPEQRELLQDHLGAWREQSEYGPEDDRDYYRRCAEALNAALARIGEAEGELAETDALLRRAEAAEEAAEARLDALKAALLDNVREEHRAEFAYAFDLALASTTPDLICDYARALPDGAKDESAFEAIENALDRAGAPMTADGRWLTLPERVAALAAAPSSADDSSERLEKLIAEAVERELNDGGPEVPYSVIAERVAAQVTDALELATNSDRPTNTGDVIDPPPRWGQIESGHKPAPVCLACDDSGLERVYLGHGDHAVIDCSICASPPSQ